MKPTTSQPARPSEPAVPSTGSTCTRRGFVKGILAAAAAANAAGLPFTPAETNLNAQPAPGHARSQQRRNSAYKIRQEAALLERNRPIPSHPSNGDEHLYSNKLASFSKGMPHDDLGEVDGSAYRTLLQALNRGEPEDFESIPMGCPDPARRLRFVNPQAGLAFDLEGADAQALAIPPAPAFSSLEQAGEMLENYWMAVSRDLPFSEYDAIPLTLAAAADLSSLADFRGPNVNGQVTPGTLFRGLTPGDLTGPYISQFMWLPAPFGANYIEQRMRCHMPGTDYLTHYEDWLNVQRGWTPAPVESFDPQRRYIRNGRDLAQWVHVDVLYQAYFHALMILLAAPSSDPASGGIGAPFDAANPYRNSQTQVGFGTFGGPHIAALLTEVATRALKAVWFQKWFIHRRLRPEMFAGRLHNHLRGAARYPLASDDLLGSPVLRALFDLHGSYLLPLAFPEGCPLHPSYGAGHATVAGACVTILKAWFDESFIIPNPVQATPDGLSLLPYPGPALTVGGELNKLASNVAIGRNIAGVHWRSDATESLKLGEAIAISVLRDQRETYNEHFTGFKFTRFDGTPMTV